MLHFTSDHHFGHARIIELCKRPFSSIEEMNETMIERWNSVVAPNDSVIHLGDIVMGTFAENINLLRRLNGWLYLVPGNHDRVSKHYVHRNVAARQRFTDMYLRYITAILPEQYPMAVGKQIVTLSHFPFVDDRYPEACPKDDGQWLIHGHVHDEWQINDRQINVGVDVWDFYPVSKDTIRDMIS